MTATRSTAMPLKAKLVVAAVVLGALTWWLADRQDRVANEKRLSAIATAIAERPVKIDCPGRIGRLFSSTVYDGTVAFDAAGGPADEAKVGAPTCAELDALAEGRRTRQLDCVERSTTCGDDAQALARAVDVLTHESWHLRGIMNEAETECHSLQTMAWAAQRLGATEPEARRLALLQFEVNFPMLPARYRSSDCHDGGTGDLRPDDPRWP